jgi:hypothetical protein
MFRGFNRIAGILTGLLIAAQVSAVEFNTDRPGMDYRSLPVPAGDHATCRKLCEADAKCQAWTYVKPGIQGKGAFCWLKHQIPPAVSSPCCISGTKMKSPGLPSPGQPLVQLPDLTITNITIKPMPVLLPRMQLHMFRSYRVRVSVLNKGGHSQGFMTRTMCSRAGTHYKLGEGPTGPIPPGGSRDVVYDIYPSSAGAGNCMMRTKVDADNQVKESDESPASNTWDKAVTILP